MTSILANFNYEKNRPTDINEHLQTLKEYAAKCEHVTEMGVRDVVSTWAFLAGNPKRLISYDLYQSPIHKINQARALSAAAGIEFDFRIADTTDANLQIEETDLLFIDTWHIYEQLKREFELHAGKVRKYIILHDTTLFGEVGTPELFDASIKHVATQKGLWPAVEEFLAENPQWKLHKRFTHNNGLTILEKV
jgi:hypothetical protein